MPEDSTEGRREIRSETRLQSPHFPQPSIEKALFAFVCDQREGAFITPSRVARRALPAQKIRARYLIAAWAFLAAIVVGSGQSPMQALPIAVTALLWISYARDQMASFLSGRSRPGEETSRV